MEITEQVNNRLEKAFKEKSKLLNIYFTAGYPNLNDTTRILKSLQDAGADMVEIGMPFSDPMADGPTIQASSDQALRNGMNMKLLFDQLKDMRKEITIPVLLMGYLNPVMQYGIENFCKKAAEVGVDGIILPDLPIMEYQTEYKALFESLGLSFIFLVTPQTSPDRLKQIDESGSGFIYVVSTESTTGNTKSVDSAAEYFERISKSGLKNPTMIGFNIKDKDSFNFACNYSNGAIIGSAFIKMLADSKNLEQDIKNFVLTIKG